MYLIMTFYPKIYMFINRNCLFGYKSKCEVSVKSAKLSALNLVDLSLEILIR